MSIALASAAMLGGCVTAASTTRQVNEQSGQLRSQIAIEQNTTRHLQVEGRGLQSQIASLQSKRSKLLRQPSSESRSTAISEVDQQIVVMKTRLKKLQAQL